MKRRTSVAAVAALALLALTACGSKEASSEAEGEGGNNVAVTLDDYAIRPEVTTLSAGEVTFKVSNAGATEHEMVVIRTDLDPADIPFADHEANEEAPGMTPIGEVEEVQPGEAQDLVLTLEPGSYILLCNLPKHFERGMVTKIEVA
ncbi:MAG TPA: cupredoxin domain-containing protein [Actinomycetota bacterium]